ncbi:flavin-containing monooxygenase [Aspergillus puulaauensis]|uniref:Flavin-containing monooxygenase n=1 Tax=Aspergillus puulaauensis TaxID=1220207 RepID=A0A7R7XGZ7_9EURO|nr:uncharacterized protein APUU_21603S [Aspergillus puulaauensis]BCS21171.1 hypothetical protein APUU_21603S [Aspergillus puulaauensis]
MASNNDHIIRLPQTPTIGESDQLPIKPWIDKFNAIFWNHKIDQLGDILHENSWWRDMLALTWDFRTLQGLDRITSFVRDNYLRARFCNFDYCRTDRVHPEVEFPVPGLSWVRVVFTFDNRFGGGNGVAYLTKGERDGQWKAYSIYTALDNLNRSGAPHPERTGRDRPEGNIVSFPCVPGKTWLEQREELEFHDRDPTVLIVGAGQAGLNLAARLKAFGQSCLIIEQNGRVGDNWRKRYRTLVTHDRAEISHMAYLPFPETWPKYTPKDKLADWLESYASIMDLSVWTNSNIENADYSDAEGKWSVRVVRDGARRTLRPRHIAWCTGLYSIPKPLDFQEVKQFKGTVYHGSEHDDASKHDCGGKRVVVVGTGNTGHDIAEDYFRHGANVTIVQRSATYVLTQKEGLPLLPENAGLDDDQTPSGIKDVLSESLPWPVALALSVGITAKISNADRDTLQGLSKLGFKLEFGIDGAGILRQIVSRAGGYYIDVGCCQLLFDGLVKVKHSPGGIKAFDKTGIILADGGHLDADIVVLATGYESMNESVRQALGDKVADRCNQVWGLDEEGELRTIWRPSGHPGFWFMAGSLAMCRIYSKFVALQIAAAELKLVGDRGLS